MIANTNKQVLGISASVMFFVCGITIWMWNQGYGEMSEGGFEISMSLYSACNRHDEIRITRIEELICQGLASGKLHSREGAWLQNIVNRAKAGRWESASKSVRRLMNDQIRDAKVSGTFLVD